jgi:hypothetical protein
LLSVNEEDYMEDEDESEEMKADEDPYDVK